MIVLRRQAVGIVSLVVLAGVLSCCGSGSADGSGVRQSIGTSATVSAAEGATQGRKVPQSGGCGAAIVRLGPSPGAIDFTMRCKARQMGTRIRFAVGVSPLSSDGDVSIRKFRQFPRIEESESRPRHARCRRYGGGLACIARVRSIAVVSGRFWVRKGRQCDIEVTISESVRGRPCVGVCTSEGRRGAVVVDSRARGC